MRRGEGGGARLGVACLAERGDETHHRKLAATLVLAHHQLDCAMPRVVVEQPPLRRPCAPLVGGGERRRRRGLGVHGAGQAVDDLVRG
jgi:hypothetical protein